MPVEQVVRSVCNYKQAYTQFGGLRPFGTAFLFAGDIIPYECDALMMMPPLPVSLRRIRLEVRVPALPDGSFWELQRLEGHSDR